MENGRSPVLGSSQSECEGTELMEGAAAAVGRQQSLGTVDASFVNSCCSTWLFHLVVSSPQARWTFICQVRVHVIRTTPQNPSRLRPRRSPVHIRLKAQNQRSPDLLCYTNNLLRCHPNPSTGYLTTLQVRLSSCMLIIGHMWHMCAHLILSHPLSLCRWRPGEAAVHVSQIISSSTSKEALDLRTCREHGASFTRLPEVPRPSQPCSNGRALPAVRDSTCRPPPTQPNHRGAQQDSGPHHAEVWEVRVTTEHFYVYVFPNYGNQVSFPEYQLLMCFEKTAVISFVTLHLSASQMGTSVSDEAYFSSFSQQTNSKPLTLYSKVTIMEF